MRKSRRSEGDEGTGYGWGRSCVCAQAVFVVCCGCFYICFHIDTRWRSASLYMAISKNILEAIWVYVRMCLYVCVFACEHLCMWACLRVCVYVYFMICVLSVRMSCVRHQLMIDLLCRDCVGDFRPCYIYHCNLECSNFQWLQHSLIYCLIF